MFQPMNRIAAATLFALSLAALSSPKAHAQSQPKPIVTARAEAEVYVDVVIDSEQGSHLNGEMAASFRQQMASTDWQVLENGLLQITKNGQPVLSSGTFSNKQKTYFLIHARSEKMVANGEMYSYSDDPARGWARLFVTMPSKDGKSFATVSIGVPLTFVAPNTASDGGFDGFGG
jgi:hypothetical protein